MCVCVCVCVQVRESESERVCVCVREGVCVCVCEVVDILDMEGSLGGSPLHRASFDVCLDKGTYDAISLDPSGVEGNKRSKYIQSVASLLSDGGVFLITSCNWTQEELSRHFGRGEASSSMSLSKQTVCFQVSRTILHQLLFFQNPCYHSTHIVK